MDVDGFDADLCGHVWLHLLIEPLVMFLPRLPDLGDGKTVRRLERDVVHEPRVLLELRDQLRGRLVITCGTHPGYVMSKKYGYGCLLCEERSTTVAPPNCAKSRQS